MARMERRAHYVGTWREDHVSDATMRQIIARSHAEKGQKVKVKLSLDGLTVSRTVLFQENLLLSFALPDVYFLTVNPSHPSCLLCIMADPVRKFLILVLRMVGEADPREMIDAFQRLKNVQQPAHGGNVVLRRKDNGSWTLRERSQHNANQHLQQVFKEASISSSSSPPSTPNPNPNPAPSSSSTFSGSDPIIITTTTTNNTSNSNNSASTTPRQPNGHVHGSDGGQWLPPPLSPFFDDGGGGGGGGGGGAGGVGIQAGAEAGPRQKRAHSAAAQTVGGRAEGNEGEMAQMRMEVETLTQELRDIKMVLEKTGTLSPRSPRDNRSLTAVKHNNNDNDKHVPTKKSQQHAATTSEVRPAGTGGHSHPSNGPVVTALSDGSSSTYTTFNISGRRPGEARVFVDDHREDAETRSAQGRGKAATNKPLFGRVQRQITVPEPNDRTPPGAADANGFPGEAAMTHTIQRVVYRGPAATVSRKVSSSHSMRSGGGGGGGAITIVPAAPRRSQQQVPRALLHHPQHQFRSMRISRTSGVPTTIMRPIEEIYSHHGHGGNTVRRRPHHNPPVVLVQTPVAYSVQDPAQDMYIMQQQQQYQQQQAPGVVYVAQEPIQVGRPVTPTSSLRRPRSSSSPGPVDGAGFLAQNDRGELDDVLL